MSGKITTHVLDISLGVPAGGVYLELYKIYSSGKKELMISNRTNEDGRLNEPLLRGNQMTKGSYELLFFVGDYFSKRLKNGQEIQFLDQIPIRFGIANVEEHYHVPLLLAPGGYSTYRGS
ncbi:hydroxyisourate hydrolase [Alkalihalobacillus sp. BA299]|uniref:hydroxyisourate hydrolase n=1 Tax=Alkalihalobacillus sp. BA299 TaxID=2815938 RepID=UPI001ADC1D5D|nr:hydroxyisourate hydrolase [Alkalihalobacillus sp. BA299]